MTKIKAIEKGFVSVDIERFFDLAGIEKPLPVIEEIPPILFRIRLSMERMHPEISKVYFDEQFSKMEECVEWINDAIPFPTHKPHSPLVTEHAKHLSNLDPDYV